ncbi:MAG: N-acetyltransferase [Planctomycetota bacterium]
MSGAIEVRSADAGRDLARFIDFPYRLYRGEDRWVPPLRFDVKNRLDRRKNPFFDHSEAAYFLAWRDGRPVGRIAAIDNRRHREFHGDRTGFFGWFDCEDDPAVAVALLDRARAWLRERGLDRVRGPASFSLNDECGLLVEGFDEPCTILTPWNPPSSEALVLAAGLEKVMDLVSFLLPVMSFDHERVGRIADLVVRREGVELRRFRPERFAEEVAAVMDIYNDAWEDNWGFVPMTARELDHMAKELKPILEPALACFAEKEGKPVGFSLVLPDVNLVLKKMKGRLFPFGIFHLLFGLKRVAGIRLIAMGVSREFHKRGLDALLYLDSFRAARDLGKEWSELGWVLETNQVMINTIERVGGRRNRVHRLYEGPVD